jgi:uncharacterized protein (DUF2147 family)
MYRSILLTVLCALPFLLTAQDIAGRWTTIDDQSGKPRSVVEIIVKDGVASGRIVDIVDPEKRDKPCTKCTGDKKDKPVLGMRIIEGMRRSGTEWSAGTILDPESGRVYDCKIWLEDGRLKVRGYVAFFYRTQTWVRN